MRDIKGNNNGVIIDKSQTIIFQNKSEYRDSRIEKEETTFGKIVIEKIVEVIIGFIFTGLATIMNKLSGLLDGSTKFALIIILFILGIGMILAFLIDAISLLKFLYKGDFVELISRRELIIGILKNPYDDSGKDVRRTGKCYKRIEGKIYKIKGKKCPICETEPIGNMYLRYSRYSHEYFWECSQNQAHRIKFDYKKKV